MCARACRLETPRCFFHRTYGCNLDPHTPTAVCWLESSVRRVDVCKRVVLEGNVAEGCPGRREYYVKAEEAAGLCCRCKVRARACVRACVRVRMRVRVFSWRGRSEGRDAEVKTLAT